MDYIAATKSGEEAAALTIARRSDFTIELIAEATVNGVKFIRRGVETWSPAPADLDIFDILLGAVSASDLPSQLRALALEAVRYERQLSSGRENSRQAFHGA